MNSLLIELGIFKCLIILQLIDFVYGEYSSIPKLTNATYEYIYVPSLGISFCSSEDGPSKILSEVLCSNAKESCEITNEAKGAIFTVASHPRLRFVYTFLNTCPNNNKACYGCNDIVECVLHHIYAQMAAITNGDLPLSDFKKGEILVKPLSWICPSSADGAKVFKFFDGNEERLSNEIAHFVSSSASTAWKSMPISKEELAKQLQEKFMQLSKDTADEENPRIKKPLFEELMYKYSTTLRFMKTFESDFEHFNFGKYPFNF